VDPEAGTLAVQCPVCNTPLKTVAVQCPACGHARPDAGWPEVESSDTDRLFGVDADPISPISLQLPRAVAPRISDGRIELGAPPSEPLSGDDELEDELLEFGDDSDPVGFTLEPDVASDALHAPRALRVRVVPVAGDQVDDEDVVVPLASQPETPSEPVEPGAALTRGAIFASRYRIDELIEVHGTYHCYLAVQEPMVRRVQITVLGELGGGETQQIIEDRFLREGAVLARRSHPNLGSVVDFGRSAEGACYVVTELIYGFSLAELIGRGAVEPERLASILLDLARGLAACHDAGVVHRALWADHVVLEGGPGASESMARLGGFGLGQVSALLDDPPHHGLASALAPEVIQGSRTSPASDVYAFGGLAAHALLGRPVFDGSPDQVLRAQVERAPTGLDDVRDGGGVAAALASLSAECLSKDPQGRPADGAALVLRLESLVRQRTAVVGAVGLSWRVILAAALAGALLPTLLLAAVGVWAATRPEPVPETNPGVLAPDLAEVVEAQTTAKVRDEVADLRGQLEALETAMTDAVAMAEAAREEDEREPEPPPRPVYRTRPVAPRVVAVREPEPVAAEPEPEPTPVPVPEPMVFVPDPVAPEFIEPPPPPPPPHPAAENLDGLWLGTAGGRDLALDLSVSPDGSVGGSARIKRAGVVESAVVRGQVSQVDGGYQLELQVTEDGETTSYSGRMDGGSIQGRVAQGGRTRGRWKVAR